MTKFVYWNNGFPLEAQVKGRGNKAALELPNGSVRMGRIKSKPSEDLYELVEEGPEPDEYQLEGAVGYSNNGHKVTATRTVEYKDPEIIREMKLDQMRISAQGLLAKDDWRTIREHEEPGKPLDPAIKAWRVDVRSESDAFEIALGLEDDPATLVGMEPTWPVDPREPV